MLIQEVTQKMQNKIPSSSFLFFVSVPNLVFQLLFYLILFPATRSAGTTNFDHIVPFGLKMHHLCLFFLCDDEEEDVAGGYMCVHCNILYGCPLTYEVFLRCHY